MPEEEIEYLENNDSNSQRKDDSQSSKASNKASTNNIVDFNKYKSKKIKDNSDNKKSSASSPTVRNMLTNVAKNKLANRVLNKTPLAPAVTALNTLNGIKNMVNRKKATTGNATGTTDNAKTTTNEEGTVDENVDTSNEENTTTESNATSFNPLRSLFGGTSGLLGTFSFMGKFSMVAKIGMIVGLSFCSLFFLIILLTIPVGFFSGLFGADDQIIASNSGSGNIDYGDYELSSDGDEILHESLDSFLESKGTSIDEFNNLIATNVENSGYATRAGVVAAAVTLIAELGNNYDVKIPYFWGGGHGQMIEGAASNWGSGQCYTRSNGRVYDRCGLDCSGFVAWAIYNGGFNMTARGAGSFQNLGGAERVTLTESAVLQPGDLLESSGHIILIIGIAEDTNEYICAEASGYGTGVLFTRRPFNRRGYWGVDMTGFYARDDRIRS